MKLTCTQENLNKALSIVGKVINKNTTLPILNNVLLKTDKKGLKLSSTNLELGVTYWIGGKIEEEGEITIPTKLFSNFISNLPNDNVEIRLREDVLSIKCNGYKTNIKGLSAKEYPIMPKIESEPIFKINSSAFKYALSQVLPAVSNSESRMELTGILLDLSQIRKGKIILVATDSYRLAEKTVVLEKSNVSEEALKTLGDINSIIIPKNTVQELVRDLDDSDEILEVTISERQVLFSFGKANMISRLIEGKYPDYKQVIPDSYKIKIEVYLKELLNAIRVASLFTNVSNNSIELKISSSTKSIEVSAETSEVGSNLTKIPAEMSMESSDEKGKKSKDSAETSDENLKVVYNYKYLLDGLNSIGGEKAILNINGASAPTILKSPGKEDFVYVIMPVRS
ncbi:MAG: DNA polymerase III subunit beta [Minisyncoccia bacterium]